jgi:hypothetical protein
MRSRSVGYRFGKYLGEATNLVVAYCESAKEKEGDDELREHCLQVGDVCMCVYVCVCVYGLSCVKLSSV